MHVFFFSFKNIFKLLITDLKPCFLPVFVYMHVFVLFLASLKRIQENNVKNFSPTRTKSFLEDLSNTVEVLIFTFYNVTCEIRMWTMRDFLFWLVMYVFIYVKMEFCNYFWRTSWGVRVLEIMYSFVSRDNSTILCLQNLILNW